jgi:hypothetical protein
MPVILATKETEIGRIGFKAKNSSRDPISKKPSQKRAGGVIQGIGPEFKPRTAKKIFFKGLVLIPFPWFKFSKLLNDLNSVSKRVIFLDM